MMMYRPGGPDLVNGARCTMEFVNSNEVELYLSRGWYLRVEDFQGSDRPETGYIQGRESPNLSALHAAEGNFL
jgi:hypothetical protein